MRHAKSRFIKSRSEDPDVSGDARRVGTGAVRKPHLPGGFLLETELVVNILKVCPRLNVRAARIYFLTTLFKIGS